MAISNPTDIGATTPAAASATTIVLVTTAVVPSGAKIWVWGGWFGTGITMTIAGGGLTWTVALQVENATNDHHGIAWADAPAGLASSTSITITLSGAGGTSRYITGAYSTGVALGAHTRSNSSTTSAAAWSSGTMLCESGAILIGGCYSDGGTTVTNTPSGGNTEIHDQNIAFDSAQTTCYQIGTGASIAAQGTWSTGTPTNSAIGLVFQPASSAVPPHPLVVDFAVDRAANY